MTMILDQAAHHGLAQEPPARLSLTPRSSLPGQLDGAWWPRSRDLSRELPALMVELPARWGWIARVTVNPSHWPVIPRKVDVGGRTLHVGWFIEQEPDRLMLRSPVTGGRWDLLVIPPETEPAAAARLMAASAVPGNVLTAGALMARVDMAGHDVKDKRDRESLWEAEGGSASRPTVVRP